MSLLAIDIRGSGFLKHMVRNIVGTLIRPRKGLNSIFKPDPKIYSILDVLESRDRRKAGVTAPACGLYLVEVF
jgi:tRNA pseudouridine38-40 synthase